MSSPVVLTGAQLPAWLRLPATVTCQPYPSGSSFGTAGRDAHNGILAVPPDARSGAPVNEIAAFRWDGAQFVEIPVQVDQLFPSCLSNPPSDFSIYSGTDRELTYAWDVEAWMKTAGTCTSEYAPGAAPVPDPVPTLDDDDEVVFMASDAGVQAPLNAPWPGGAGAPRQAIALTDPLDPGNVRYVYLIRLPGGTSFNAANGYVSYVRDANADQWIDRFSFNQNDPEKLGTSNTGYGPNLTGTVCDPPTNIPRASTDRFVRDGVTVDTASYEWRASGRWMVRSLRVAKPAQPGVYGPDLIDRWKGRAFQQSPDSSISLVGFEDEQVNWEANSALLGERRGPVRAIREIWGADSGTNVTKTETFYRDAITYHYHVRVHPIPPDGLYTSWDYNHGVAVKYYNTRQPSGVDIDGVNDDVGNVDGAFGQPAYFDVPDPTFNVPSAVLNWEQVSGRDDVGSLVYIVEIKGATTLENPAVVPYYRDDKCLDDGTGDDPVPRPWPGESSTDPRVQAGYSAENGGTPYAQLTCDQKQGAWGAHGVHYFVTNDTDNAASPGTLTEIDAQQWQFTVPTAEPTNVGDPYANVVKTPLRAVAVDLENGQPSAGAATATTEEGQAVDVTLSGFDVESCDLAFTIVDPPAHGMLGAVSDQACAAGTPNGDTALVTYMPDAGYTGTDSFTYKVNDGALDSAPATVVITVSPRCGNFTVEPGEQCDQGNANGTDGSCCSAQCTLKSAGTTCRPAVSPCDVAETCTGTSPACPANGVSAAGTSCRSAAGICDVAESCDGASDLCPADAVQPAGAMCRSAAGPCDMTESCDGVSTTCPADAKSTAVCRPAAGVCDVADSCDGVNDSCPANAFQPDGTSCDDGNACTSADRCRGGSCAGDSVRCGDGMLDAGCNEQCDDGNAVSGDGCSATCALEPCGPAPATGCRRPVLSGKALLLVRDSAYSAADRLLWKWGAGARTTRAEFGDPLATTSYAFCIYDGDTHLVSSAEVSAGGVCAGRPCWHASRTGYRFGDRSLARGLQSIMLREGLVNGKARIIVKGRGAQLREPPLPIDQPVTVQLKSSDGVCWEAIYSAPALRNQTGRFKDRSD